MYGGSEGEKRVLVFETMTSKKINVMFYRKLTVMILMKLFGAGDGRGGCF